MPDFKVERENVSFWLKVRPRSQRERLRLDSAGGLILEVRAAPSEGEANEACVRFLARSLRLPQVSIAILAGRKARRKLVRVTSRSAAETIEQLRLLAGLRR